MSYEIGEIFDTPRDRKYGLPDEVVNIIEDFIKSNKKGIYIIPEINNRTETLSLQKRIRVRYPDLIVKTSVTIKEGGKVIVLKKESETYGSKA